MPRFDHLTTPPVPAMTNPLEAAFARTVYRVQLPDEQMLAIRVGARHPLLDEWVRDYGLQSWCFITAWNPGAEQRDRRANAKANVALFMELQGDGHPTVSASAQSRDGDWPAEPGFLVLGVSEADALGYAGRYGQRAVVFGTLGAEAGLRWSADPS
ncbi:MAG: DUF3293 domain-containing protein [Pseudomonadota bacterium]